MKKISLIFVLLFSTFVSTLANAGYSSFYKVEWIRTAEGGFVSFRNSDDSIIGEPACPNAVEVRWSLSSGSDYYKRVFAVLMLAKSSGAKVRWWNCGCDDNGSIIKACDIDIR